MPTYSFGEDSPLKFEISDKLAQRYNEAVALYLKTHRRFTQKYGRKWDPNSDPISVSWNRKQRNAWNEIAELFNELTGGNNHEAGPFLPIEFHDDFLVRNAVSAVSCVPERWLRVLGAATMAGALYGLLRGR